MNQKLRTARYGIAILLAVLCIVCLSLSLAFSAQFAAFAAGEAETWAPKDAEGNDLWLIHYTDADGDTHSEGLWSGLHGENNEPIKYLAWDDATNSFILRKGTDAEAEKYYYSPYRATDLTIALNGNYKLAVNGETKALSELYDLKNAVYNNATVYGGANGSETVNTSVTADSLISEDALALDKQWMVATLCNDIKDGIPANYLGLVGGSRGFATKANVELLAPEMGNTVIYDFVDANNNNKAIAVVRTGDGYSYHYAPLNGDNIYGIAEGTWEFTSEDAIMDVNYINYTLRRLDASDYTLKIVAYTTCGENSNYKAGDIYYASSSQTIKFSVTPQPIDGDSFLKTFGSVPVPRPNTVTYTGSNEWLNNLDFDLRIDGLKMEKGKDYIIEASSYNVGFVDLLIIGQGNLKNTYTLTNAIQITPAINDWDVLPNITPWKYGDYDKLTNQIVGMPKFPLAVTADNINDVTFRIVLLGENGVEIDIEGLNSIHFVLPDDSGKYLVSDEVAAKLDALGVGTYRMYASVYGVTAGTATTSMDRDYYQLEERFVNFNVIKNENGWDSENGLPSIVSWTAGKYDRNINIITAMDRFGNEAIIVIRDHNDEMVYSNDPRYVDQPFGNLDALKKFKAGLYTLEAQVKGNDNYGDLSATIRFTVARNGLPTWAVILIVVGALSVVALTFGLLHQKGVLQMLTGKVIISMRTRANVDATLAAIRAAKMARDAEASIAAAKAREAEEAAKENKGKK